MVKGKKRNANMKDVAAVAGVSIATISRYLNGNLNRMSKDTAKRIKIAIDKLNYVPNSAARQMITRSSKMIAVVVANIDDYFSTELFKGVSSILESNGYIGALFDSDSKIERETQLLKKINSHTFDGLILQPLTERTDNIANQIRREIPITIVDRELTPAPWPQVVTNNYQAAYDATEAFKNKGFSNVIVITSDISQASTRQERYDGIAAVANSIEMVEVSEESYNHATVLTKLINLLTQATENTLIFGLKERWLLEFLPTLVYQGYVDGEKAVATGFADTDLLQNLAPSIHLINQNPFLMGASAAEVMVNSLAGKTENQGKIVIPAHLK